MNVAPAVKSRIPLILFLIVVACIKIPHLYQAYYWDESWPYVTAIFRMSEHGVSLMPGAIDPELSRGHPLFFHALGAIWIYIFGTSHVSFHAFALTISLGCLGLVYEAGLRLFNRWTALFAVLLLGLQVLFFVQSSMVLPEMLVAFLAFAALYFYAVRSYVLAAAALTMLFYTKESGMVLGVVLGIDAIIQFFRKKADWKARLFPGFSVLVPTLLIGLFFLLQKKINGWYVFPLYGNGIEQDFDKIYHVFRIGIINVLCVNDKKYWFFLLFGLAALFGAIRNRSLLYASALLPMLMVFLLQEERRLDGVPGWVSYTLFNLAILITIYSYRALFTDPAQRRMIALSGWFILAFILFSSMNFFSGRYLLAAIVPAMFLTAVFLSRAIQGGHRLLPVAAVLCMGLCAVRSFRSSKDKGDNSLGMYDGLYVQEVLADRMERLNAYDEVISAPLYLEKEHLIDYRTGFLKSKQVFTRVAWGWTPETRYVVFDNIESTYLHEEIKQDTSFHLFFRVSKGWAWGEIYERRYLPKKQIFRQP